MISNTQAGFPCLHRKTHNPFSFLIIPEFIGKMIPFCSNFRLQAHSFFLKIPLFLPAFISFLGRRIFFPVNKKVSPGQIHLFAFRKVFDPAGDTLYKCDLLSYPAYATLLLLFYCDCLNFQQCIHRQLCHLETRTCRAIRSKKLCIHGIHRRKIVQIL